MRGKYSGLVVRLSVRNPQFHNTGTNSNQRSWDRIAEHLDLRGRATMETLGDLVGDHESGTKAAPGGDSFARYCYRMGWIKPVDGGH